MMKYCNPLSSTQSNKVTIPVLGRTVMMLNGFYVIMYDKRTLPRMALILPAMHTNAKYANENQPRTP